MPVAARSFVDYVGADVAIDAWRRIPTLLATAVVGGAWDGFLLMTGWSLAAVRVAWFAYCACLLIAATGLLVLPRERTGLRAAAVVAAAAFILQAAFLALLRPITPMWMLSSLLPPLAQPSVRLQAMLEHLGYRVDDSRADVYQLPLAQGNLVAGPAREWREQLAPWPVGVVDEGGRMRRVIAR